jgi:hypothetical protein
MKTRFAELRCDYYDTYDHEWCIDGWLTADDDEGGFVVARINTDTFEVKYTYEEDKTDEMVLELVMQKLHEITA